MSEQRDPPTTWTHIHEKAGDILNVRAEIASEQRRGANAIDRIGHILAQPVLFFALLGSHVIWVVLNLPFFPWEPWDPYPFVFLATVASAEAPFLALLVLMYQRRQSRIAELREEFDLQVALHLERQSSVVLRLLVELQQGTGVVTRQNRELLDDLQEELDPKRLMQNVRWKLEQTSE